MKPAKRANVFSVEQRIEDARPDMSWPDPIQQVDAFLSAAETTALNVYRKYGLPTEIGRYYQEGGWGPWLSAADNVVPQGTKQFRFPHLADNHPRDSEVGFAYAVLRQVEQMRPALAKGRYSAHDAIAQTVILHRYLVVLTFEFGFGTTISAGRKVREAARTGGQQKAAQNNGSKVLHGQWRAEAARYRKDHPAASAREVAKHVAKVYAAKWETVRKALRAVR
jgi:hypothetical protein